ncbi:MAG TPA: hypothetical protein DCS31_05890 [Candidatus Competibacteraceae bacterium]|jgi:hypothetical protein|nr:hypothetical protein [Candidatus Competibacteraceae bacterium]
MNRSTLARLERRLKPDGITREIVAMLETPDGYRCACGEVHPTMVDAERTHAAPGVLLLVERVVSARPRKTAP